MSLTTITELIATTLAPLNESFIDVETEKNEIYTDMTAIYTEANISDVNATLDPIPKNSKTMFKMYDILIPLIGTLVIISNGIVVVSSGLILKRGAQPRTTYLFLGNVAMADLVTGLATVGGEIYPKEWRGAATCIISLGLIVSSTLTSVMSVGLIGVDRFLYIVHGLQYQQWLNAYRARWLIAGSWVLCLTIGFLPGMGWIGTTYSKRCWFILLAPPELIMLTVMVGILPMVVIIVLYSIILYHALRKVMQLRRADKAASKGHSVSNDTQQMRIFRGGGGGGGVSTAHGGTNKQSSPKKSKAILVVFLTAGSFVITWLPFFIACQLYAFCVLKHGDTALCKTIGHPTATILPIIGFFNSLLNPLIYAWWHKGFRGFMCNKLRKKAKQNSRLTAASNSSAKTNSTNDSSTKGSKRSCTMSQKSSKSQNSQSSTQSLGEPESEMRLEKLAATRQLQHEEPAARKTSIVFIQGPFIGDNEDTHL